MSEAKPSKITAERIRYLFDYNPETGEFKRRVSTSRGIAGTVIKAKALNVDRERHKTTRYIWLHYYGYWPEGLIDHANRDDTQNQIANLREVTHSQNQQNKVSPNSHGYKGITWRDRPKPWLAKIRIGNGMRINLGSFVTKEEAARAYEEACLRYHGKFAQLGVK